ncbi:MAG: NAD(P)-dependent alcohol dehydrogenase [Armatimonadota bacterium]|nr:MAG: NAD(P)-dependent alcohol dehydrogenase [Armatimonadota bacterium]
MSRTAKAVYLHGVGDLRIHEEPVPQIAAPNEVLIRVAAVGVCGSDCHFYRRGRIGRFVVKEPIILGHEFSGTVVDVGAEVEHLKQGDQVAVEPGIPCRRCQRCREGRYNLCEREVVFMATPGLTHGAFREYLTWPADLAFKLPERVSLEDGAMVEPLAVGVQACRRAGIVPGQSAAVLGAGPIGLLAAQAAASYGAHPVVVTDVVSTRVALAEKLGMTAVDAGKSDVVEAIRARTEGRGVDAVIETAGTLPTVREAMAAVKTGGVVVLVGMLAEEEGMLRAMDIIEREYDVRGVFRYATCYLPALSLIAAGRIDLASLRTHEFPLDQTEEAIKTTIEDKAGAVKVLVRP